MSGLRPWALNQRVEVGWGESRVVVGVSVGFICFFVFQRRRAVVCTRKSISVLRVRGVACFELVVRFVFACKVAQEPEQV